MRLSAVRALGVLLVAWSVLACGATAGAATIQAPFLTVGVGDTFEVDVAIADAADLAFFQFDLAFGPSIVNVAAGAAAGAALPGDWFFTSPGFVDNSSGDVFGVSASGSPFGGGGAIATFQFTAIAPGVSPLNFSSVFLNLSDSGFQIANGQITVTGGTQPIPEPSTIALFGGAQALFLLRRRARRSSKAN